MTFILVLFLNLERGLWGNRGRLFRETKPTSQGGDWRTSRSGLRRGEHGGGLQGRRRSHSFSGRGGRLRNWRSQSSRLLLPEQILAELLRHQRLQPAPLTLPLPWQPLTAISRGPPRYHRGRATLPTAGHVPRKHCDAPQVPYSLALRLKKKWAAPTERSAPTGTRPLREKVDASCQCVDCPLQPWNRGTGKPGGPGLADTWPGWLCAGVLALFTSASHYPAPQCAGVNSLRGSKLSLEFLVLFDLLCSRVVLSIRFNRCFIESQLSAHYLWDVNALFSQEKRVHKIFPAESGTPVVTGFGQEKSGEQHKISRSQNTPDSPAKAVYSICSGAYNCSLLSQLFKTFPAASG